MVSQMETPVPIDVAMLQSIGITKPGHAKRLLMKLEEPSLFPLTLGADTPANESCCGGVKQQSSLETNLYDWLAELKLEHLYEAFNEAGYEDIDLIRDHMKSRYPLDESVLRDEIRVCKPGYRLRILGKLHAEIKQPARRPIEIYAHWEKGEGCGSCSNCVLF